jgi:hypothetical protein
MHGKRIAVFHVGRTSAALERCGEGAAGCCFARAQRQRFGGGAGGRDPREPTVWMATAAASTVAAGVEFCSSEDCGRARADGGLTIALLVMAFFVWNSRQKRMSG